MLIIEELLTLQDKLETGESGVSFDISNRNLCKEEKRWIEAYKQAKTKKTK